MSRRFSLLFLLGLVLAALILTPACGTSPSDPVGDDPPDTLNIDWPEGAIDLPEADLETLSDAGSRYAELRESNNATTTRQVLISEMASWPNVGEVFLLSDERSIQIVFADLVRSVLLTGEANLQRPRPLQGSRENMFLSQVSRGNMPEQLDGILLQGRSDCSDMVLPSNLKVSLVNLAGGIRNYSEGLCQDIQDHLISLGWDPNDIRIVNRDGYDDFSFTPDTVFDQSGYGIVFFLGTGGFTTDDSGSEYYMMEGFRGGSYEEGYEPHVTEERWEEYKTWFREDGTLVGSAAQNEAGESMPEVYIREDLLSEQMKIDEGAMVHVLTSEGFDAGDAFEEAGAGCVTGWIGNIGHVFGADTFKLYMEKLVGSESEAPMNGYDASNALGDADYYEDEDGSFGLFGASLASEDFMLSAALDFEAPFDCLEEGTEYYDVSISYPGCPEYNSSFQFFPGGDFALDGLPPIGANLELTARDAGGAVLGKGSQELQLAGGPNRIELCPCEGSLHFAISPDNVPPGTENLLLVIDYDDPDIPDQTRYANINTGMVEDLIPGMASIDVHATSPAGFLGNSVDPYVNITCDGGLGSACFGWFSFEAIEWPEATVEIQVETVDDSNLPNPLIFAPGDTPVMFGFWMHEETILFCSARSGTGELVGVDDQPVQVHCGDNRILLEFDRYGVMLEANPDTLPARWDRLCELKGTVRYFTDFDIDTPTGEPVRDKLVTFETTLGDFTHEMFSTRTDENGEAIVYLYSDGEPGTASVMATLDDGLVESLPDTVVFTPPLTVFLDRRPEDFDGDTGSDCYETCWVQVFCNTHEMYWNDTLWFYDDLTDLHFYNNDWNLASVGDTLTFIWYPEGGCADPEDPYPWNAPFVSESFIHWCYGYDYEHQITRQVTNFEAPLSAPLEVEVILTDPLLEVAPKPVLRRLDAAGLRRRGTPRPADHLGQEVKWKK